MLKFGDQDNKPPAKIFAEGDYAFTVVGFEIGIQEGGKSAGAERYDLELAIAGADATVFDSLFNTDKAGWRIDTFIKCCGVKLAKGQGFDFNEKAAASSGVPWVNPIGLRGWCHISPETYAPKDKPTEKKTKMKVSTYYTDKQKLPLDEKIRAAAEAAAAEDEASKPF